ncbi:MAG: hypothetical protein GC200_03295 [Tepidisphaera sp.]|nr:hypothetical protein [Tepidisphaera sp.]
MWVVGCIILALSLVLAAIDVFATSRLRLQSRAWDIAWAAWYAVLALAAAWLIFKGYEEHWPGLARGGLSGREAALQFLAAFAWLVVLDVDGVYIVSTIFGHLGLPPAARRVVLAWSVPVSLLVRWAAIAISGSLLLLAPWLKFLMSGVLILAALRMLLVPQDAGSPDRYLVVRLLKRVVPVRASEHAGAMITLRGGRLAVTPLVVALATLTSADVYLAIDSVPAGFALSHEPVLLLAATALALPCLRSLYAALEVNRGWLPWVKVGLSVSLGYAAFLIAAPDKIRPSTLASLMVLGASLASGLVLALAAGPGGKSAIGPGAERFTRDTLSTARKSIVFVVGMAMLILGLIMLPGPGPGIPVTFAALAILGNEFAWARRLMEKYRDRAMRATEMTAAAARKRFKPWILVPLIGGTIAVFLLVPQYLPIPMHGAILGAIPTVLGQMAWGYIAFFRKPPANAEPSATPPPDGQ